MTNLVSEIEHRTVLESSGSGKQKEFPHKHTYIRRWSVFLMWML